MVLVENMFHRDILEMFDTDMYKRHFLDRLQMILCQNEEVSVIDDRSIFSHLDEVFHKLLLLFREQHLTGKESICQHWGSLGPNFSIDLRIRNKEISLLCLFHICYCVG